MPETGSSLELLGRDAPGRDQSVVERVVLLAVHRRVEVVRGLALVVTRLREHDGAIE